MDLENPTKNLLPCRVPPELGGAIEVPRLRPDRVGGPLLKLPREEPSGFGGPTIAPKAEKIRKQDSAQTCLPGTGTLPRTGLDQLPLLPLVL